MLLLIHTYISVNLCSLLVNILLLIWKTDCNELNHMGMYGKIDDFKSQCATGFVRGPLLIDITLFINDLFFVWLCIYANNDNYTEPEMSSFWRNFHHWLHRKLSFWQLSVQPVMKFRQNDDIFGSVYVDYKHKRNEVICDVLKINTNNIYWHGLTLIPAWISNHTSSKLWAEITYPYPNFNGCTVEVWEWISNFILGKRAPQPIQ